MKPRVILPLSLFLLFFAAFGQAQQAQQAPLNTQPLSADDFFRSLADKPGSFNSAQEKSIGGVCNLDCIRWSNACNNVLALCDKIACLASCPCGTNQSCLSSTESACFNAGCTYSILPLGIGVCQCV